MNLIKTLKSKNPFDISFALIALALGASLIPQTLQYIEFYKSMENLSIKINDISFQLSPYMKVNVELAVSNPSGYSKLELEEIRADLFYEGEPHEEILPWGPYVGTPYQKVNTTWWKISSQFSKVKEMIPPHGSINSTLEFSVHLEKQEQFVKFYEQREQSETIVWRVKGIAFISTNNFLEKFYLQFDEIYQKS